MGLKFLPLVTEVLLVFVGFCEVQFYQKFGVLVAISLFNLELLEASVFSICLRGEWQLEARVVKIVPVNPFDNGEKLFSC